MERNYYVYAHYKVNGELFYIGKGKHKRKEDTKLRSEKWVQEATHGFFYVEIASNLTSQEALLIEASIIKALHPTVKLSNIKIPQSIVKPIYSSPKELNVERLTKSTPLQISLVKINDRIEKLESQFTFEEIEYCRNLKKTSPYKGESDKQLRIKYSTTMVKIKDLKKQLKKLEDSFC